MKLLSTLFSLVLIAALVWPFLANPPGDVTATTSDMPDPTLRGAGTPAYKWQDQYGNWQFGEDPPDGATHVEAINIVPRHTALEAGWSGPVDTAEQTATLFGEELSIIDVYTGKVAEDARKIHAGN